MFTGLIEAVGQIEDCQLGEGMMKIYVASQVHDQWQANLGDSIAVNGCCLTLAETIAPGKAMLFEVSSETLNKTNFGDLKQGSTVNLSEPCA